MRKNSTHFGFGIVRCPLSPALEARLAARNHFTIGCNVEAIHFLTLGLTKQEGMLVKFLWRRDGGACVEEIERHLADRPQQPGSILKAIYRLRSKLARARDCRLEIRDAGSIIWLNVRN